MSWKDIVKESWKTKTKLNYIIKILESHKNDFENSKSDDGAIRQAIKMIEVAINYAQEIKEELQ